MGLRRFWDRVAGGEPAPEPAGPPLRVAVYARDELDKDGKVTSAASAQEAECRAFAEKQRWEVVASFSDHAVVADEGTEISRDGLRDLRAAVWRRSFDAVLASRPERLYYDVERLVRFARESRLLGTELVFVHTPRGLDLHREEEEF